MSTVRASYLLEEGPHWLVILLGDYYGHAARAKAIVHVRGRYLRVQQMLVHGPSRGTLSPFASACEAGHRSRRRGTTPVCLTLGSCCDSYQNETLLGARPAHPCLVEPAQICISTKDISHTLWSPGN
jgi:hypothetical protein